MIVESRTTFADGALVEQEELHDDGTVTVKDGAGQVTATRPATPETLARVIAAGVERNRTTIEQRAKAALTTNAEFLADQAPTQATVLAQVRALTRETTALIRLMLDDLDSDTGA